MTFFEIHNNGNPLGWITFELFEDECPLACYNFRMLCSGELGVGQSGKPLHYLGSKIFRIVPGLVIQGGDIICNDGSSGESAHGTEFFDDEQSSQLHDKPGLLCTATLGRPNTNTSQFYITVAPCPWQDGRDTVFGRVRGGFKVIYKLEQMGSARGDTIGDIRILNCGVVVSPSTRRLSTKAAQDEYDEDEQNIPHQADEIGTAEASQSESHADGKEEEKASSDQP